MGGQCSFAGKQDNAMKEASDHYFAIEDSVIPVY